MGNYLASLRVAPPAPSEEQECNHPLYYDWTVPKWNPFRETVPNAPQASKLTCVDPGEPASSRGGQKERDKSCTAPLRKQEATQEAAKLELKDKMTSTVDLADDKPINFKSAKASKIAKSTSALPHKKFSSSVAKGAGSSSSTVKVDSTRPHTVDAKKYSSLEDQAAIKASTNIHDLPEKRM